MRRYELVHESLNKNKKIKNYRIFGTPLSSIPFQTIQTHQHSITHDQHQPQEDIPSTTNSLKEDEANCKRKVPS